MAISVHTNNSAMIALQNLNKTSGALADVQGHISTGLRIQNAKDNASVWAIAQGQRADIGALASVRMSLERAQSISEVTLSAGESVSDLLVQLKEKVVAAMDPSLDAQARTALNSDFQSLLRQIKQVVDNAEFDGANMLKGTITTSIKFLANAEATSSVTLSAKTFSMSTNGGGPYITFSYPSSNILTKTQASLNLARVNASLANVNQALGDLGAQAKQIENHTLFVNKLSDVLTAGVGNLVDADLAKESARLQALQVQQQLGAQALSIANQAPQVILSLFRS
ncbi:MAG: flagellin [Phenylobacterium sp.]|jgi:flagellin|uniref:flagellin N-terminal helical domain-containing protein n=1 Tax=Phenylobacterium sp. TaxID=1871053 RepID=UPI002A35B9AD|nr:flagellin [Phenylobacterium sp.]MDX9998154.1 flagellin [Phenylobacterium sp.]